MPYSSNSELPDSVKSSLPSEAQTVFRQVANTELDQGSSEESAIAQAWTAVKNGWQKNKEGEWVRKIGKAEYQGREVELDKPFRTSGESKKFAVYVKDGDSVKIVRFGDPSMEIRRDDKEARASFRSRHSCDTATDKTSARYWSCRMWDDKPVSEVTKFEATSEVCKVDDSLGLVFGYAMVCKIDGEDHFDLQGHHIPEDTMLRVMTKFMESGSIAKEMHSGEAIGKYVFAFPMTTEIAKSLSIEVKQTGALVAMKPDNESTLQKFRDGTFTGFSIGGIKPVFEDAE